MKNATNGHAKHTNSASAATTTDAFEAMPRRPTDTLALVDVSQDLEEVLQDYRTAEIAISGLAADSSHDPATVACTMQRLNARLEEAISRLEASRGGQPIHPAADADGTVTS